MLVPIIHIKLLNNTGLKYAKCWICSLHKMCTWNIFCESYECGSCTHNIEKLNAIEKTISWESVAAGQNILGQVHQEIFESVEPDEWT